MWKCAVNYDTKTVTVDIFQLFNCFFCLTYFLQFFQSINLLFQLLIRKYLSAYYIFLVNMFSAGNSCFYLFICLFFMLPYGMCRGRGLM